MANYIANTTADLIRYVGLAANGDKVLLNPGTYSAITLQNIVKSGNVTIASANASQPAVLTDLMIKTSSGLTFSDLEFTVSKTWPFQVQNSSRIVFDQIDIHGSLNGSSNDDFQAMLVRNSDGVTVSNSHFHEVTDALVHVDSRNLLFDSNLFETVRDNGISGGGSSFVTISDNVFKDFDHVGPIHPDAIQFWTTNTTTSATDITVSGNVVNRGSGAIIQGFWINDDVGTLPYKRVTVTDNVVIGAAYNGIVVSGATDAVMRGNVVIGQTDQQSSLAAWSVGAMTWTDNIASTYLNRNSTVTGSGDIQTLQLSMADAAALSAQLDALALPGQLGGLGAMFGALALADVLWLDYIDTPPTSGLALFDLVPITGTAGNDRLYATALGSYHLMGLAGNDALVGGSPSPDSNILEGGTGNDNYTVYSASDVVIENAGEGNDAIYAFVNYTASANVETIRAMQAGVTVYGNTGDNTLTGVAGGVSLYAGAGNDLVQGSTGNDTVFGDDGNDRVYGYDGNDRLDGGNGDDTLYGANGNDTINAGAGVDSIEGGAGADVMTGGAGADMYIYRASDFAGGLVASRDTITDFNPLQDKISLGAIDAKSGTSANDYFAFISNQAFHGVAGELRYVLSGDGIDVLGDTNGDRTADISIHLSGLTSITQSSFML